MATATLLGLRARMTPPATPTAGEGRRAPGARPGGTALRRPEVDRVLHLATDLFGVAAAALVLAGPDGLTVEAAAGPAGAPGAVGAACRLFEVLAASEPPETGRHAGVMEEVAPGPGFVAATPILSAAGRCLGAVVLLDGSRRTLLSGLQRRLFAEFGDLLLPALGAAPSPAGDGEAAARLQALADAEPDAFALFDLEGRCLLRNARFDALVGAADPTAAQDDEAAGGPVRPDLAGARGCEASWIALRLARDVDPVGVYRAALADGTWLSVEERRGPHGRSLLARVEAPDAFGGDGDLAQLFERCPYPMFVFDRDTRAVLAVNAAALALYGWDRDAFLRLDLDGIGPVGPAASEGWTHRTRDGRALPVSGRTVDLAHRGRPAVLVTVESAWAELAV
ncbi:PAS domain-containing protein [Lichenibacterium dinghuense]|uniref:PAS domain-containing protein n=1 Tax=Lichenibacterium dinghuense TaxID=2895977 RepID=UPI001F1E10CA|nr:PAS domain-containing protein [Lichenibacterium sp. 6Y81]